MCSLQNVEGYGGWYHALKNHVNYDGFVHDFEASWSLHSKKLTYSTLGKGKPSSNMPYQGGYVNSLEKNLPILPRFFPQRPHFEHSQVAMCDAGDGAVLRPGSVTFKGRGRGVESWISEYIGPSKFLKIPKMISLKPANKAHLTLVNNFFCWSYSCEKPHSIHPRWYITVRIRAHVWTSHWRGSLSLVSQWMQFTSIFLLGEKSVASLVASVL